VWVFGCVALDAADLEGESGAVDEEPDHDLRVDTAFFGVADFAEEPRCSTTLSRRSCLTAIWTAVAPDAVRT
jgi:hypothetical protein